MSDGVQGALAGDRAAQLTALRDRLAWAIDNAEPKELAPLARQFVLVTAELAELSVPEEVSVLDELRARRADRESGADASGDAAAARAKPRSRRR